MSKQTATEWLIEQVKSKEWQDMFIWHKEEVFNQAKAMEKEQHGKTWDEAIDEYSKYNTFEEYYIQTYKGGDK